MRVILDVYRSNRGGSFGASSLIGIIIDAAIIYYLNTKGIKAAFFGANSPDLLAKVSGGRLHDEQIMKNN